MRTWSSPYTLEFSFQAQLKVVFSQVSYLTPGFPVPQSSFSRLNDVKCCQSTLEMYRHGSEEIPFLKEGNLAKDAAVPGKQKPADVWLSSLAPGRVCKTRTIPQAPIRKVLLEKSKARKPQREDFITTAGYLTICLPASPCGFHTGW